MNIFENINIHYNRLTLLIGGQNYVVILGEQYYNFWDIFTLLNILNTEINN